MDTSPSALPGRPLSASARASARIARAPGDFNPDSPIPWYGVAASRAPPVGVQSDLIGFGSTRAHQHTLLMGDLHHLLGDPDGLNGGRDLRAISMLLSGDMENCTGGDP